MHHQTIIDQLKHRREAVKITQETLADISGVGLRTLKQLESGKGNPTLDTITRLADVLGLHLRLEVRQLIN